MWLVLTDAIWERLEPLIERSKHSPCGVNGTKSDRMFLEALLHLSRTGCARRDLPEGIGKWNAMYQRFKRWRLACVFERLFAETAKLDLSDDVRRLFVDSTVIRAHAHAAGAQKKGSSTANRSAGAGAVSGPRST